MVILYQMPEWLLALLIIGVFSGFALAGLALTRPWVHRFPSRDAPVVVSFVSSVGVLYAVLLAMIAVASWNNYQQVETLVSQESDALHAIFRDLEAYPPATRDRLRSLVREYVELVIHTEFPALQKGGMDKRAGLIADALFYEVLTHVPETEIEKIVATEILSRLNAFQQLRRNRIQTGISGVQPVLWLVVLVGAVLNVGLTYLFSMDSYRLQQVMTGTLGVTIGVVMYLIVALDHPLWGKTSVSPVAFQMVADSMDRIMHPMTPAQRRLSQRP